MNGGILNDDNDTEWEDIETYTPDIGNGSQSLDGTWMFKTGRREIFIDIPNPSIYRRGEVFRVRTTTLSPAFLRSYKKLWELPHSERARTLPGECNFVGLALCSRLIPEPVLLSSMQRSTKQT